MILAVTGHRPDKLGGYYTPNATYNEVVKSIGACLLKLQPSYVITGMAQGVDQWTAELCIQYGIPFTAAIPCDNQEGVWPPKAQERYHKILSKAFQSYIISPGPYEFNKMQKRNEWMVDSCNVLMAVWNGTPGGTANCVKYAKALGRAIEFVPLPSNSIGVDTPSTKGLFHKGLFEGSEKEKFKTINTPKTEKIKLPIFIESIKKKAVAEEKKQVKELKAAAKKNPIPFDVNKSLTKMTPIELIGVIQELVTKHPSPEAAASYLKEIQGLANNTTLQISDIPLTTSQIQNLIDNNTNYETFLDNAIKEVKLKEDEILMSTYLLPLGNKTIKVKEEKKEEPKPAELGYKRVLED